MYARVRTPWSRVSFVSAALVIAALAGLPANAEPNKPFSADVLPTCVPADSTVTFTVTLRNETTTQQLGSANVTPPTGFTIVSATAPATVGGNVLLLRDLAVPPGGATTATFQAETPSGSGSFSWNDPGVGSSIVAKQSNDFHGEPGNNLTFRASTSNVTTHVDRCILAFEVQPADAEAGANVTGSELDPDGPPVAVEVLDGPGGDRVPTSGDEISLELVPPPDVSGAALSPAVPSATAAGGLALFDSSAGDGFSVTPAGDGYQVRAVARPGIAPATSDPFDVIGAGVTCTGPGCTDTVVSETGVSVTVTAPNSEAGDVLTVALDVEELTCPGYTPLAGTPVVTFTVTGDSYRVITMRIPAALATRPVNEHRICYGSELAFTDRFGVVTNTGLLPTCPVKQPSVPPCQQASRIHKPSGDHIVSFIAPPGSTRGRT